LVDRIDGAGMPRLRGGDEGGEGGAEGVFNDLGDDRAASGAGEMGDGVEVGEEKFVVLGDGIGAQGDFAIGRAVVSGWGGVFTHMVRW